MPNKTNNSAGGGGGDDSLPNKTNNSNKANNSVARLPMNVNASEDLEPLDLRGLKCPLPALFARRALRNGASGHCLTVLTDDPMAPVDIPHMCWQEGFEVLTTETREGVTALALRRP